MRRIYKSPVLLFLLFFGFLSSAAIAATTISINSGSGIPLGSGRATVGVCDSDITMSASTSLDPTSGLMRVATISVGGLDMRYPEGCAGKVLDVAYLLNGTPTYASFNIPSIGLSNGTFILSSPSNACNQANETLNSFSATTLSSVSISPNFSASYQSASNYSGTSIVSSGLKVNLDASSYSGVSGNSWQNLGSGGSTFDATPKPNTNYPSYTSFGGGSCFTFQGDQRFTLPNPVTSTVFDFTLGAWFKTIDQSTQAGSCGAYYATNFLISGDKGGGSSNDYSLGISSQGNISWGIGTNTGGLSINCSTSQYNDGIWHYVSVTRSASPCKLQIYVDGSADATGQSNCSTSSSLMDQPTITIASDDEYLQCCSTFHGMRGSVAKVHMYERVLSSAEIAQNYNAMRSFFGR